jgi:hypothetical protein
MVVSAAIVIEREEEASVYKVQCPVYYISEVLSDSKIRYRHVQKLLYALLITSRKLRHYFESHKITVVTDFPLRDILHNRDATGLLNSELSTLISPPAKWSSPKRLLILLPSGQKSNNQRQIQSSIIERCTLMDHSN